MHHSDKVRCRVAGSVINTSLISRKYLIKVIAPIIKSFSLQISVPLRGVLLLNINHNFGLYSFVLIFIISYSTDNNS